MINIKELRLGNLVYIINRNSEVHLPNEIPFKVLTIGLDVECLMYKINPVTVEKWNKYYYKDLSPIPLTEEWLLKFGFKQKNGIKCWVNEDVEICFETLANYYRLYPRTNKIKYVHQLQNLYFALTGSELQYVA